MEKHSPEELKSIANTIRQDIIKMIHRAGSGHPGGALGMADIFTALYFSVLNHVPTKPKLFNRDRLILSNGHICPVLYASLARSGYWPLIKLRSLRKINSNLQGHPHAHSLPGIETSSGPLGQGLSQAIGMALASKLDDLNNTIFCITSDGEHNEGQTWEAIMSAKKFKLDNLVNIIDRNNIQIDGYTKDIMPLKPLKQKYEAFGWQVVTMNGHNMNEIINTLQKAKKSRRPVAIIAYTTLGKGVSFMENQPAWHGKAPNDEEKAKALVELQNNN